ncbi:Na+/H+ antiporter subunit E [Oceanibium sediminis]|uniref:Na+/H+ antiporter subunit E n=1 Tax=Oceanibium sediminis TaxID=2026339 RepID=UPI000DD2F9EC|nr:Na+/H+ antiporter subunit E [Oceanibium sediminis]
MNLFVLNLILAISWAALSGAFSLVSLSVGFVLGYGVLWILQPLMGGRSRYFRRLYAWGKLLVMFHYELVVSSLAVTWDVLTPRHRARPGFVEMPLDVKTDAGILLVTNLISLTPGTLSLNVSDDRKTLLVHAMFMDDPDAVIRQLKNGMEKWVREAIES